MYAKTSGVQGQRKPRDAAEVYSLMTLSKVGQK